MIFGWEKKGGKEEEEENLKNLKNLEVVPGIVSRMGCQMEEDLSWVVCLPRAELFLHLLRLDLLAVHFLD